MLKPMREIAVRSSVIGLPLKFRAAELAICISRAARAGSEPTTRTTMSCGDVLVGQHLADAQGDVGEARQLDLALGQLGRERLDESKSLARQSGWLLWVFAAVVIVVSRGSRRVLLVGPILA